MTLASTKVVVNEIRLVLPLKAADPIMPQVVPSAGMCWCLR